MLSHGRVSERYTYPECLTKCLVESCHRARIDQSPEQGVAMCSWKHSFPPVPRGQPAPASLLWVVQSLCFLCLFPDMRSAATGTDQAIGNIAKGIVGHLGYCQETLNFLLLAP